MNKSSINIGTSGWYYSHWIDIFYPKNITKKDMLSYYSNFFSTVEVNNTFYRLPDENTLRNWTLMVPEDFIFSVKASLYITHRKKLTNTSALLLLFLSGIKSLKHYQGPILFQLPPYWKCNLERLKAFLETLPTDNQYVFEFRESSWWNESVYDLLKYYGIAFCIFHLAGVFSPEIITADFTYLRLHGPSDPYQGLYSEDFLQKWAGKIKKWNKEEKTVYCYFDNDQAGFAVKNALRLKQILSV